MIAEPTMRQIPATHMDEVFIRSRGPLPLRGAANDAVTEATLVPPFETIRDSLSNKPTRRPNRTRPRS